MTATDEAVLGLVAYGIALVLLAVLLILDIKFLRDSRRIAKSLDLPKG